MPPAPPTVTYYVVLPQQRPDVGASIRPISRLLQDTEENVRIKLATETYEVLTRFGKKANADGLRQQLKALGIETFVLSDSDIRGHLFLWAAAANRGAGGMALRDFADKPLYCPYEDMVAVAVMDIQCEGDKKTTLIDIHRKSTNIVPRLDSSLFDFASIMQSSNAGIEEFLAGLEEKAKLKINRKFAGHREALRTASRDFGSRPSQFLPPDAMLVHSYERPELLAADMFSLVLQNAIKLA